ncbi:MAG: hypothetical protein GOU97_03025 [Nanoarchaeota archaeon]|nr:hypothetical protein [Nanoarchaeota archaeon]
MKSVREDVLNVIKNVKPAIREERSNRIRDWSNHTIHSISVFQDEFSIGIAIILYSLAKILEKYSLDPSFGPKWKRFKKKILKDFDCMEESVKKGDVHAYSKCTQRITEHLSKIDENYSKYVRQVIESSKIKKGSKVYEHGISLGRTAEMLGISKWELMDYLGVTKNPDVKLNISESLKERWEHTKKIFGAKK